MGVATLPPPLGQRDGSEEPLIGQSPFELRGSSSCSSLPHTPTRPSHRASGGSLWTRSTGQAALPGT